MSEFKGTQGKWIVKNDTVTDENGFSIASIEYPYRIDVEWGEKGAGHWNQKGFHIEVSEEESLANERLISKSPEMLKMLIKNRLDFRLIGIKEDSPIIQGLNELIQEATSV